MDKECLKYGYFSRSTIKSIDRIFNFENEKRVIELYYRVSEWFSFAGLRRTGKTTLARSIAKKLTDENFDVLYINLWETDPNTRDIVGSFLQMLKKEVEKALKKHAMHRIMDRIKSLSFLGVSVEFRSRNITELMYALEELTSKSHIILIVDEVQEIIKEPQFFKNLSAIHDRFQPNISCALLGSISSVKNIIETDEESPLYGRLGREIILKPLSQEKAIEFLKAGFDECNVSYDSSHLYIAYDRLGGFPGWLINFGRTYVLEKISNSRINIEKIFMSIEREAELIVFSELARLLRKRRNYSVYLKIIRLIAEGENRITNIARASKKTPQTVYSYLEFLIAHGIIQKEDEYYYIPDPMIRKAARKPYFEDSVIRRIKKLKIH